MVRYSIKIIDNIYKILVHSNLKKTKTNKKNFTIYCGIVSNPQTIDTLVMSGKYQCDQPWVTDDDAVIKNSFFN